ncbi:hypothetical protein A3A79_03445 [Candidatus Gottesmanbacteria bacterium RIFCSPLOWO2_01_FULL_43_11b]|uniref:Ribbon-helix-helix protein CopG domain-containing protein n=1 Tax=Candidatus Gottesmanbacteria bacterium RIFCSPLOWO2_01_FULL_43_11b TaxID=1798392 RepID=A0A1F6AIW9_9BACT|nr:MAG: hypothetical protein A3A79_03445 [Candidatus Gottesmanbacteria bacterium RIFCSPLOWO2_01_FULL_43_11b]
MDTISSATVKVNLPTGILRNTKSEANRIGISVQDFIRMLLSTYFARSGSIRAISRDEELFDRAQSEIAKGQYTRVTSAKKLRQYLDSLDQ